MHKVVGVEEMIFIKTTVNQNVDRWRPYDIVTITDGKTFTTFSYQANGSFLPSNFGSGIGPGQPMNHDGKGNACN